MYENEFDTRRGWFNACASRPSNKGVKGLRRWQKSIIPVHPTELVQSPLTMRISNLVSKIASQDNLFIL